MADLPELEHMDAESRSTRKIKLDTELEEYKHDQVEPIHYNTLYIYLSNCMSRSSCPPEKILNIFVSENEVNTFINYYDILG